ncbi:unnamed protein product [Diatraea saccharalis]|uniref:Uncharacterized protein n=1 Tax=Diatraea saccharalis TaxID=40085 RepID=A0A9N9WHM0_9NEOP|nr:unnamed protein product [Diatraea saccharalis]
MSYNYYGNRSDRTTKLNSLKDVKTGKSAAPKKVIQSKTLGQCSRGKSCSAGIIIEDWYRKPRKSTQSDINFSTRNTKKSIDYCKKCGDQVQSSSKSSNSDKSQSRKSNNVKIESLNAPRVINKTKHRIDGFNLKLNGNHIKNNGVKQYYKNENFKSTISLQDTEAELRKMSLDTIKELPEFHTITESGVNIYNVLSDSEEEIGFLDTNKVDNVDELKKFREDNYFECHSVKSRIDNKGSVTSLVDHKCVYRFYLNDRLFPVPVSTDHHDNVRCVECHLPITLKMDNDEGNGTIQAKVNLGDDKVQDMILFLPVKKSLMIKERRKQIKTEEEVLYFGVIKLDAYGNSVFNSTLPGDSLALKYQKGYQEHRNDQSYKYNGIEEDDVIVI